MIFSYRLYGFRNEFIVNAVFLSEVNFILEKKKKIKDDFLFVFKYSFV